jgi:hypothetical protein
VGNLQVSATTPRQPEDPGKPQDQEKEDVVIWRRGAKRMLRATINAESRQS